MNGALEYVEGQLPKEQLLAGLQLDLRVFDADTASGRGTSLGFQYDYAKKLDRSEWGHHRQPLIGSLDARSSGTVAFDRRVNPADFLRSSLQFSASQFRSGLVDAGPEWRADALQKAVAKMADMEDLAELEHSAAQQEFNQLFREAYLSKAGLESLWGIGVDAALESDQAFVQKQYTYGLEGSLVLRDWRSSSLLQVFDVPFALLRTLTGSETGLQLEGRTIPTTIVGLDAVTPTDNDPRRAIEGGEKTFARFRSELETRGRIGRVGHDDLFLSLDWRYFHELNPSSNIRVARFDTYSQLVATVDTRSGWLLSYATGRLPLDQETTSSWQMGWHWNFGDDSTTN
jgi:hypothetical protein